MSTMLIGFSASFSNLRYLEKINNQTLWDFYSSFIVKVNMQDILKLSSFCLSQFYRLKLASMQNRYKLFCNEENKAEESIALLSPGYEFDVLKYANTLMYNLNLHSLSCQVVEDLARVGSLRHELDAFIFLTISLELKFA